jgi:hypothetical protein
MQDDIHFPCVIQKRHTSSLDPHHRLSRITVWHIPNLNTGDVLPLEARASFRSCTHTTCISESSTHKTSKDVAGQSWK